MTKLTNALFEGSYEVEMVEIGDIVDSLYGISTNEITLEQIEQLKRGKIVYFDDGEYAHVIRCKPLGERIEE